jgi:lipopolysaccharide biosynthesis glycosyltransferase
MTIDLAFSLNKGIALSLLVAMNSVVKNTAQPEALRFNVAVPIGEGAYFQTLLADAFPGRVFDLRLQEYLPPEFMQGYLVKKFARSTGDRRLGRYMQYARLFLGEAFPGLGKTIYLDTDILVLGDVADLYGSVETFTPDRYFAAASQFFPSFLYFSNPFRMWGEIRQFQRSFNSGVILTDFSYWNRATYERLRYYLNLDARRNYHLFNLGDETVLNLMFKDYIPLEPNWNRCGYGNHHLLTRFFDAGETFLKTAKVIHWSGGHHKPWKGTAAPFTDLWKTYLPPAFQGHE